MQPMNYKIDTSGLQNGFGQGLQGGFALRQAVDAREQAEIQRQQQAQMNADLMAASRDISLLPQIMVRYPQLADKLKHGMEAMSAEQQRTSLDHGGQVLAALQTGRGDIAANILRDRATALRNSGDERGAQLHEAMAQSASESPDMLRQATALRIAAMPGGDKVIESIAKLGGEQRAADLHGPAVAKAEADASTAQTTAKFAERKALTDLEEKGWNIKKVQADIISDRERNRIAAMSAALAREGNSLKKQELQIKVDEARMALDDKVRGKVSDYESGQATLQDALSLLTEIRSNPDALASATGASAWTSYVPGSPERTVSGKVEQLQNTLAATNLDKLKGAMSDKDLLFLKNIATNLDRYQNQDQFLKELDKVEQVLIRNDKLLRNKYGASITGRAAPATPSGGSGGNSAQRNVVVDW